MWYSYGKIKYFIGDGIEIVHEKNYVRPKTEDVAIFAYEETIIVANKFNPKIKELFNNLYKKGFTIIVLANAGPYSPDKITVGRRPSENFIESRYLAEVNGFISEMPPICFYYTDNIPDHKPSMNMWKIIGAKITARSFYCAGNAGRVAIPEYKKSADLTDDDKVMAKNIGIKNFMNADCINNNSIAGMISLYTNTRELPDSSKSIPPSATLTNNIMDLPDNKEKTGDHEKQIKEKTAYYEKQIGEKNTKLADYERQIKENNAKLADYERQIKENNAKLADYERQIKENNTKLADYEKQIKENIAKLADYEKQIMPAEKTVFEADKLTETTFLEAEKPIEITFVPAETNKPAEATFIDTDKSAEKDMFQSMDNSKIMDLEIENDKDDALDNYMLSMVAEKHAEAETIIMEPKSFMIVDLNEQKIEEQPIKIVISGKTIEFVPNKYEIAFVVAPPGHYRNAVIEVIKDKYKLIHFPTDITGEGRYMVCNVDNFSNHKLTCEYRYIFIDVPKEKALEFAVYGEKTKINEYYKFLKVPSSNVHKISL